MFLEEISDDLLICLYREGNQEAIDLLLSRYRTFMYGIINDLFKKENEYIDYDDMYQDAMVVFFNCLQRYDVDNGCFYFFVRKSIERRLIDKMKKIKKNNKIYSLDDDYYEDGNEKVIDYVSEDVNGMFCEEDLFKKIDDVSKQIIKLKVSGYTYEEISLKLSMSKQCIYRRIVKIKKILKDITKN